jgi:hypothetical protein
LSEPLTVEQWSARAQRVIRQGHGFGQLVLDLSRAAPAALFSEDEL